MTWETKETIMSQSLPRACKVTGKEIYQDAAFH